MSRQQHQRGRPQRAYKLRRTGLTWMKVAERLGYDSAQPNAAAAMGARYYAKRHGLPWPPVPVAILFVPNESGLLAPGRCNSAAPCVIRGDDSPSWQPEMFSERDPVDNVECALPLWWDGALVGEGWDRLCRALDAVTPEGPRVHWLRYPLMETVAAVAMYAAERGPGRAVVVDTMTAGAA